MYQILCASSSVSGMAITSPNAQTFLSVQNALLKDMITMWTPEITLFNVPTANLIILPPLGTSLDGRMRRKFFLSSTSVTSLLSRPAKRLKTTGKTSCSRVADRVILTLSPQLLQKMVVRPANFLRRNYSRSFLTWPMN